MTQDENLKKSTRYHFIDTLRGIVLLNMVLYHLLFDLVYLFGKSIPWYSSPIGSYWQRWIAGTFILLAGISVNFSKSNTKRGILLLVLGGVLTAGTALFLPEELILFGILHFMGCACIIGGLLRKYLERIPPVLGCTGAFCAFILLRGVPDGFLGIGLFPLVRLPDWLYQCYPLFPLGFPTESFSSGDYFPLLPFIFLFFTGFYLWKLIKSTKIVSLLQPLQIPVVNWIGRHTLLIYMLHQPLLYGILSYLSWHKGI